MKHKSEPFVAFEGFVRRSKRIQEMHFRTMTPLLQTQSKADSERQQLSADPDEMEWAYDAEEAVQLQTSRLLSLPPELRNRIYEHVLIEKHRINVTSQLRVPALLHTSRQIRAESRLMWFKINRFLIIVKDLDANLVHAWHRNICSYSQLARGPKISIVTSQNWPNLLEWCQRAHATGNHTWSSLRLKKRPKPDDQTFTVAATALQIARAYRGRDWEDCKKALENHRLVAAAFNTLWLRDY